MAQHRPTSATRGGERDLRRDERVAVPVTPDPAPQCEWGHRGESAAELVLEGLGESFVHARRGLEQAVLQVPEGIRHLVHDRRPVAPHLLGEPEQLHLALETTLDGATLGLRGAVPRQQTLGEARLKIEDGASSGFGGMRGEDRPDLHRCQGARDFLGSLAGLAQASQRPAHRSALHRRQVVLPRSPHPMGLFRGVDQNEEHRKGACREPRRLRCEGSGVREQRVQVRRSRDAEASGAAAPAQVLDRPEGVLTCQPSYHPAQRRREPANVLAERRVLGSRDRRRQRNARSDVRRRHSRKRFTA